MAIALEAKRIIETVALLRRRIDERFPGSGLGRVCSSLLVVAEEAQARSLWIGRPIVWLRVATALFMLLVIGSLAVALHSAHMDAENPGLFEFIQTLEAGINNVVLMGAAMFFLWTIEGRLKRRRALDALHELRALAHVIDMHQLHKDPERIMGQRVDTASSPRLAMTRADLGRYLDYCSEMLSLIGKVAALYAQSFHDEVALAAVNEVEALTTGLANKIWQKITILHAEAD